MGKKWHTPLENNHETTRKNQRLSRQREDFQMTFKIRSLTWFAKCGVGLGDLIRARSFGEDIL